MTQLLQNIELRLKWMQSSLIPSWKFYKVILIYEHEIKIHLVQKNFNILQEMLINNPELHSE